MYVLFLLILVILAYVGMNYKVIKPIDILLITIGLFVLLYVYYKNSTRVESFVDAINTEEDVTLLTQASFQCQQYNTVFNKTSYSSSMYPIWKSIIPENAENPKQLRFSTDSENPGGDGGLYLGATTITGPNASDLGITFNGVYTVLLAVRHDNMLNDSSSGSEVEFLRMSANSSNNNGLRFFIKENTLKAINNVQTGELYLKYEANDDEKCLVSSTDEHINFELGMLTYYFLIKDTSEFRIIMMTGNKPDSIMKILSIPVNSTSEVTFSNSPIVINKNENWSSYIYNFSIFKSPLTDTKILEIFNHINDEYMKRVDPNFNSMVDTVNNTVEVLEKITSCPFDSNACNKCNTVPQWHNINDVINANDTCKTAIHNYCNTHQDKEWCKCWNTQNSALYNSANCKLYRSIFAGQNSYFNNLSDSELSIIKSKYKFLNPDECKQNLDTVTSNKWRMIDQPGYISPDKVKVKLHDDDEDAKRRKDKRKVVNYYAQSDPSLDPALLSKTQQDFSVSKMIDADVDMNFDPEKTIAFKEYATIKAALEKQKSSKSILNQPAHTDSYFDKFLRVMMP